MAITIPLQMHHKNKNLEQLPSPHWRVEVVAYHNLYERARSHTYIDRAVPKLVYATRQHHGSTEASMK